MRLSLATLERRIERFEKRARLLNVPPLVVTCTGEWAESDRIAYAEGDEETRSAIAARYLGDLGEQSDALGPLGIVAVIVNVPLGWELDEPDELDEPIPDESAAKQAAIIARLEADMRADAAPSLDDGPDPLDSNPDGDQNEVIYHHPQFGPVRRAEHQLRRRLAREQAQRDAQARGRLRP